MMKREKLAAARYERGWSQTQLAEKVGVGRETVSLWERGLTDPYPTCVHKLCEIFEKDPRDLDIEYNATRKKTISPQHLQIFESPIQIAGASLVPVPIGVITPSMSHSAIDQLQLDHLKKLIETCWQLLKVYGLTAVVHLLPTFLPSLDTMAQHPSIHQKSVASLAAQGYIINGLVAVLQLNYTLAEEHCKRAIIYSRLAEDKNLEVAALKHLATKYMDSGVPQKVLRTYQQALPLINEVSPLLRSRTYLGLAFSYAQCGQQQEAWKYFGLAEEAFPENFLDDPGFMFADCGPASFNHYGGLICMEEDEPGKAWKRFAGVTELHASVPERIIIELINCQAEAAIANKDMELAMAHIQAGIAGAIKLNSDKRWNDIYSAYKKMRLVWPHERQVKDLAMLFRTEQI